MDYGLRTGCKTWTRYKTWTKLYKASTRHCLVDVRFKVKHSLVPVNISDLFNLKNTQYNLSKSNFELPRFETVRFGRNSIKYLGSLIWWKLP